MSKENLLEKLEALVARYHEIGTQLGDPSVIGDRKRFLQLNKSFKELEQIVEAEKEYRQVINEIEQARQVLSEEKDEEFRAMAKMEIEQLEPRKEKLEE